MQAEAPYEEEHEEDFETDPLLWDNLKESRDPFFMFLFFVQMTLGSLYFLGQLITKAVLRVGMIGFVGWVLVQLVLLFCP